MAREFDDDVNAIRVRVGRKRPKQMRELLLTLSRHPVGREPCTCNRISIMVVMATLLEMD